MVLQKFFRREAPSAAARFCDDRVGYAVGDIHGRADLLERMLDQLEARAPADRRDGGEPVVVFLGDYIDRGPQSRRVVELLLDQRPRGFERRFLKGNHEATMLDFLADSTRGRDWISYGGLETFVSYGASPMPFAGANDEIWEAARDSLEANMSAAHRAFFDGLERYVQLGDYAFVHAGVNPTRPLDQQSDDDLFWRRTGFGDGRDRFGFRVVHGHTPATNPVVEPGRIGIDTGAYASGKLTAARFEGDRVEFLVVTDR